MYSNPAYYILLIISFILFTTYLYGVYKNNKIKVEFVDIYTVDNRAYWVYNNKLYYAKLDKNILDNNSVSKVDTFGMKANEAYKVVRNNRW